MKQKPIYHFLLLVSELLETLNIDLKYIFKNTCIDASKAMSNSIKKNFPDCNIIMCYYHLKSNIKKNKSQIPAEEYLNIMTNIANLHISINQEEYAKLLENTLNIWKAIPSFE